jgi:virginiamycin A acetyltransferase
VRFLLGGVHRTRTAAIADFNSMTWPKSGIRSPYPSSPSSTITIGHDVWVGDEAYVMMGTDIATGCVIGARSLLPANTLTEPYGIYAGSPARLIRFRFPEAVRAALLDLAWWDMPVRWMRENNDLFMNDLADDEAAALETLAALAAAKEAWFAERAALANW